jgi:hypothetical protein
VFVISPTKCKLTAPAVLALGDVPELLFLAGAVFFGHDRLRTRAAQMREISQIPKQMAGATPRVSDLFGQKSPISALFSSSTDY